MIQRNDLNPKHAALAQEILGHGIDADEVLRLRRDLFADGVCNRDEARLLFHLNEQAPTGHDPAWYDFFVEALSDFFVWRQEPQGYLSDADAGFLIELVERDGRIDDATEFALLINILHRLKVAPDGLVELALKGVEQTVLGGGSVLFGPQRRRPGVIDDADVDLIRAVVFAGGGDGSLTITRREADMLMNLNRATRGKKNAAGWQKLFVEAVGHHLMYPERAPAPDSREEAQARDAWLDRRRGTGGFMSAMAASLQDRVALALGMKADPATRAEDAADDPVPLARAAVDAFEAQWLAARLLEDGELDANEVALLAYVRRMAPQVDTALDAAFARAGL